MATKPTAAIARLLAANNAAYNETTNPGGLAVGGHRQNFVPDLKATVDVGQWVEDMAGDIEGLLDGADDSAVAAAASAASAEAARAATAALKSDTVALKDAAAGSASAAAGSAAGVNLPAVTIADAGKALVVKSDGTGYAPTLISTPEIKPITLTTPAANATGVFAGGTYTFVARAFVGDTTGFYSNYGVAVLNRFVNVYEPGGTVPIYTFTATGGGPTLVASTTGTPLVVSHTYQFEFGYTDVQGNVTKSPKVTATTNSVFVPPVTIGTADGGGFRGFENFGDGYLYNLITAAKSTEASYTFARGSYGPWGFSRTSGPSNVDAAKMGAGAGGFVALDYPAAYYADQLVSGGFSDWYHGAIDELRAISARLKPSAAPVAAFQVGGAEVFGSGGSWSSTELTAANANAVTMSDGADPGGFTKSTSLLVRPIRRVQVPLPAGLTYGQAYEGGFLIAAFTDMSVALPNTFLLILSDKATEVTRAWGPATSIAGSALSRTNGPAASAYINTGGSTYAAAFYCEGLTSGTKTDWYLPAIDELLAIFRMNANLASGQQLGATGNYWSSTEADASKAKYCYFSGSTLVEDTTTKTNTVPFVRAVRRVLLPTS